MSFKNRELERVTTKHVLTSLGPLGLASPLSDNLPSPPTTLVRITVVALRSRLPNDSA